MEILNLFHELSKIDLLIVKKYKKKIVNCRRLTCPNCQRLPDSRPRTHGSFSLVNPPHILSVCGFVFLLLDKFYKKNHLAEAESH